MTTIAASSKSASIACDLQFTYGAHTKFKGSTKIMHLGPEVCVPMFNCEEAYMGFAGNADVWGEVVTWFTDISEKPPKCRNIEFLMLTNKKQIFHGTNLRNWMLLPDKHFAVGSGMQFALAAMTSGKTPIEACRIASKHDPMTGMGFKTYSFD